MSLPTSWLFGALAIASMVMCYGLWPIVRTEAADGRWWGNKSFWLSFAFWVHGAGGVMIFAALLFARVDYRGDMLFFIYLLIAGFSMWFASKTTVIHVTGRLQLALALYALWTLVWIAWRLG